MIPLLINNIHICKIFEPNKDFDAMTDDEIQAYGLAKGMFPTEVLLTSETYSRDAERTADYELENLTLVNRKAKPEFTWSLVRVEYVRALLSFLSYDYAFKDASDLVIPRKAPDMRVTYLDFTGQRTIDAYLGQTIEGVLVEYDGVQYWQNFRIAFPER